MKKLLNKSLENYYVDTPGIISLGIRARVPRGFLKEFMTQFWKKFMRDYVKISIHGKVFEQMCRPLTSVSNVQPVEATRSKMVKLSF